MTRFRYTVTLFLSAALAVGLSTASAQTPRVVIAAKGFDAKTRADVFLVRGTQAVPLGTTGAEGELFVSRSLVPEGARVATLLRECAARSEVYLILGESADCGFLAAMGIDASCACRTGEPMRWQGAMEASFGDGPLRNGAGAEGPSNGSSASKVVSRAATAAVVGKAASEVVPRAAEDDSAAAAEAPGTPTPGDSAETPPAAGNRSPSSTFAADGSQTETDPEGTGLVDADGSSDPSGSDANGGAVPVGEPESSDDVAGGALASPGDTPPSSRDDGAAGGLIGNPVFWSAVGGGAAGTVVATRDRGSSTPSDPIPTVPPPVAETPTPPSPPPTTPPTPEPPTPPPPTPPTPTPTPPTPPPPPPPPPPTPTPPNPCGLLSGGFTLTATVVSDPANLLASIGAFPGQIQIAAGASGSFSATGANPWVDVHGTINCSSGGIHATGQGGAGALSLVSATLDGTIQLSSPFRLTGTYRMSVLGGPPLELNVVATR